MPSSDIHGTCHLPAENPGASLANCKWLKITYFKNTSFGLQGKQLHVVQLIPMYIQEDVCYSEPLDTPDCLGLAEMTKLELSKVMNMTITISHRCRIHTCLFHTC